MKKLFILTTVLAFGASLAMAQAGGASDTQSSPKRTTKAASTSQAFKAALNPQPLPPGAQAASPKPAGSTKVNPQPLPPGSGKAIQKTVKSSSDSTPK